MHRRHLEEAQSALENNDRVAALEELLAAWRLTRSPEIADAITIVSADISRQPHFSNPLTITTAILATARASDLAAVLPVERVPFERFVRRLTALERWPDDPRLAEYLAEKIAVFPWRQVAAERLWKRLFRIVARLNDPRLALRVADRHAEGFGESAMQRRLAKQLAEIVTKLKPPLPLEPIEAKLVADIAERAQAYCEQPPLTVERINELNDAYFARSRQAPDARTEDELFARVIAAPDDDAPRIVLGDFWLEHGDPRGQIMALSLMPKRKKKDEDALKRLIREHAHRLVGPLAAVLDMAYARFDRGLLSACTTADWRGIDDDDDPHHASRLDDDRWGTVRELRTENPRYVVAPKMKALRVVRGLGFDRVHEILETTNELPIEELYLSSMERGTSFAKHPLFTSHLLPKLRVFGLVFRGNDPNLLTPNDLPGLVEHQDFFARLERFVLDMSMWRLSPLPAIADWVKRLPRSLRIDWLVSDGSTIFSVEPGDTTRAITIEIGDKPNHALIEVVLKTFDPTTTPLVSLRTVTTSAPTTRRKLKQVLARFEKVAWI